MFKKFYIIALSCLCFSAHAEFLDDEKIEITYLENNALLFSKSEIKNAIEAGLNYWNDCLNKNISITNKESNFNIIWSDNLDNKEFGIANYSVKENKIIAFSIEINKNKNLSLKDIEQIVAHEFGHILGLKHNLENNSIMFYQATKMLNHINDKTIDNKFCLTEKNSLNLNFK